MRAAKTVAAAACAAAMTLGAAPAFAGEVNGNGKQLPLKGNSVCKYSGLNDEINAEEPTRTQSYGTFLQFFGKGYAQMAGMTPGAGIQALKEGMIPSPGMACNPTKGFDGH